MKKRHLHIGLITLFLVLSSISAPLPGQNPAAKSPVRTTAARSESPLLDGLKIKPLRFNPPEPSALHLQSGAEALILRDHSLPLITMEIQFGCGLNCESTEQAGRLQAFTRLLRLGGAGKRNGDEIAEALALLGARLEVSADYESWSVSITALKDDFPPALDILEDILLRPRLAEDRLPVVKNSMLGAILRRNDRPQNVADRKLMEIMYPGMRRGYSLQPDDVRRITVRDLRAEWRRRLGMRGAFVLLSGDLNEGGPVEKKALELIRKFPAQTELPAIERVDEKTARLIAERTGGKIVLVEFPATQAVIAVGGVLPPHNTPDFAALQLGNYILGGGSFNSRMMREIREKRGLAYYAYSYNDFTQNDGRFVAMSGTGVKTTERTLGLMLSLMDDLKKGAGGREIHLAREAILNALVFVFENPTRFLRDEARFRRHGLPADHLRLFAEHIRKLGSPDIEKFGSYLRPRKLSLVVVGPADLKESLRKIRPVLVISPEQSPHER